MKHTFVILLAISCWACSKPPAPVISAEDIAASLVAKYKATHGEKCQKEVLKLANTQVDSLLLARARALRSDTAIRPPKPTKPIAPQVVVPVDTVPIAPLLQPDSTK